MPHLYLDSRKKPPIWRYQIWDSMGRRKTFTGTTSKQKTLELAMRRQAHENEIRDGIIPAPKPIYKFRELADEYLAWGEAQGGHHGRPWSPRVIEKHRYLLAWWEQKLDLCTIDNLKG